MLSPVTITNEEIIHQVKLSCKIPEIIEGILTHKIIAAAAEKHEIAIAPEEIQQAADQMRLIHQLESAEETWSWLERYHLSLDDFEELVSANLLSDKLIQHLFADQVEPYFFEHQVDYTAAIIYEAILDDEDLAMELFYALSEGEISFYEIAHQYIRDTELRCSGGYRGQVFRHDLKPEIAAAVFAANPSKLLKPIMSSQGVHLILVEDIIQPQLDEKLTSRILWILFDEWLKQQIAKVEIIEVSELPD